MENRRAEKGEAIIGEDDNHRCGIQGVRYAKKLNVDTNNKFEALENQGEGEEDKEKK